MMGKLCDPTVVEFWLKPDLARFRTESEAKAALRFARERCAPKYAVVLLGTVAMVFLAAVAVPRHPYVRAWIASARSLWSLAAIPLGIAIVALSIYLCGLWLLRHRVRHYLYLALHAK
jgi:hypothetical protein